MIKLFADQSEVSLVRQKLGDISDTFLLNNSHQVVYVKSERETPDHPTLPYSYIKLK